MSDSMKEAARRAAQLRARRDAAAAQAAGPATATSDTAVANPPAAAPPKPPAQAKPVEPKTKPPKAKPPQAKPTKAKPQTEPDKAEPDKAKRSKFHVPRLKSQPGDDGKPGLLDKPPEPKKKGWKYLLGLTVRLGVFAGAVVILLIAVDFGAAAVVENKVSQQMHTAFRLHDDPAVNIHGWPIDLWGFPFSNQALTGTYDHISIRADGITPNKKLRNVEYDVDLHDMHADIGDVLDGNTNNFEIPRATFGVHIRQADLGRLTGLPNLYIEPASATEIRRGNYDAADQDEPDKHLSKTTGIKLRGTVHKVDVEVYALATVSGRSVTINPQHAQTVGGKALPSSINSAALEQTSKTIRLPKLLLGAHPRTVSIDAGAVIVQGGVKNPRLPG